MDTLSLFLEGIDSNIMSVKYLFPRLEISSRYTQSRVFRVITISDSVRLSGLSGGR